MDDLEGTKIVPFPRESQAIISIAYEITHGDIDKTTFSCPSCGWFPLAFSFTFIKPQSYGLIILCHKCNHKYHFFFSQRPPNFRDDLVLKEFQELEDRANSLPFQRKTMKLWIYRKLLEIKQKLLHS